MLSQTIMSGLGVLLIVNKTCVHSRACVVLVTFRGGKKLLQIVKVSIVRGKKNGETNGKLSVTFCYV